MSPFPPPNKQDAPTPMLTAIVRSIAYFPVDTPMTHPFLPTTLLQRAHSPFGDTSSSFPSKIHRTLPPLTTIIPDPSVVPSHSEQPLSTFPRPIPCPLSSVPFHCELATSPSRTSTHRPFPVYNPSSPAPASNHPPFLRRRLIVHGLCFASGLHISFLRPRSLLPFPASNHRPSPRPRSMVPFPR